MKSRLFFFIFAFIIFIGLASSFLISDQGTDVKEIATGNLTALANLSVSIYDASTGGNLVFEENFTDAIVNGSWNVMIDPDLFYGISYWKDYKINDEDLDFDGNERLEFQSSVGKINSVSFINLSLINSCPEGSSIRAIHENGTAICELDDNSGSSYDDSWINDTIDAKDLVQNSSILNWIGSVFNVTRDNFLALQNASIVNWVSNVFNTTRNNYVAEVNTSMKNYVDYVNSTNGAGSGAYDDSWINDTVDNKISIQNTSLTNYIESNNASIENYILTLEFADNDTLVNYIAEVNQSVTNTLGLYTLISTLTDRLGNWSADKGDYYTSAEVDDINTSMTNYVGEVNTSMTNYVGEVNTSMTNYVGEVNTSMKNYVDDVAVDTDTFVANYSTFLTHISWAIAMNGTLFKTSQWNATNTSYMTGSNFTLQNISMKNYVTTVNTSMKNYVATVNTSMKNYADSTMTAQNTSQTNAMTAQNTSQTNYINLQNTSVTNALGTKLDLSGGSMAGNLNLSANINLTMNGGNQIGSNVTCVTIKGSSVTMMIC